MFFQMLMPAIVGMTWLSEPRKPWLPIPIASSQLLTMPRLGSSIHIHSSASTALGSSHGISTMLRTTTDCVRRCISTAIASARTVWMPMLMTTYFSVIQSAFQNSVSCSSAL